MARKKKKGNQDSNLDRFRLWQGRISRAKQLREDWERDYRVDMAARFYLGKQNAPGESDVIAINHFLSTVKTQKANAFLHRPKMFVRPKAGKEGPREDRIASIGEGVLDSIATQEDNLENSANLAILQNFWRAGVLKVVYDPTLEKNPRVGEPMFAATRTGQPIKDPNTLTPMIDPETGQPVVDEAGQPVMDPASGEDQVMLNDQGQPMVEPPEIVSDETYRYLWVDSKNMLLPDEGPDESRWTWIGEEVVVPLEEAREDTRFPKQIRTQLVANETFGTKRNQSQRVSNDGKDVDVEKFRYNEIYDIHDKRLLIFADGQNLSDNFLVDEPMPEGIEDHPYALLRIDLITDPDPNPWPLPMTHSWIDLQKEYNTNRNLQNQGSKRSARKGWHTADAFSDPDEAKKIMQSPNDMEFAEVTGKPGETFGILESPDLNPSLYKNTALLQSDWPVITGQSGARLANPDANTATEAAFIERAANLRDADTQKAITKWLGVAGQKMFQLVKKTITVEMFIKLRGFTDQELREFLEAQYGIKGALVHLYPGLKEIFVERFARENWQRVTREELGFEADVTVVPGSTRPKNLDVERRQWNEFLSALGQWPQLMQSRQLLRATAEKYDITDDRLIDELHALSQKMIDVAANQAGRNQGAGSANGAGAVQENPLGALLSGVQQ